MFQAADDIFIATSPIVRLEPSRSLPLNEKTFLLTFVLLSLFLHSGSKRQRLSTETDHDTGSESSPSSPRLKTGLFSLPMKLSPTRNGPPSSPESDLDVDSAPDDSVAPENLSLKKDSSTQKSTPERGGSGGSPPMGNGLGNGTGSAVSSLGFLPYHQPPQYQHGLGVAGSPTPSRSPVDVLLR